MLVVFLQVALTLLWDDLITYLIANRTFMAVQKKLKQKTRQFIESKNMLGGITIASFLESTIVPIPL